MTMHRLNKYATEKPDFRALADKHPAFQKHVKTDEEGKSYINFKDAASLRSLTETLLLEDWNLSVELREDRLCPTLANRLEYVHRVLDLEPHLSKASEDTLRILDIGTGHVAIYPLLLHRIKPDSVVYATECDQDSLKHSQAVLEKNNIPSSAIKLLEAPAKGQILFPLLDTNVDITMCNPPFYASRQEMEEGMDIKAVGPHAAPTASSNELITRGGEVAFISQMITESLELRERATWYTSLIGKYSSVLALVDLLRSHKIDNYFITSIKPARTQRWILAWSFGSKRVPDSVTRPEDLRPGTSYARSLPLANTFHHVPISPPLAVEDLRRHVIDDLIAVHIPYTEDQTTPSTSHEAESPSNAGAITIRPLVNTWSRAARRKAARGGATDAVGMEVDDTQDRAENGQPMFEAQFRFIPPVPPKQHGQFPTVETTTFSANGDWRGATLCLDWISGSDRETVHAFWSSLLKRTGIVKTELAGGAGRGSSRGGRGKGDNWESIRSRGRGRIGRGNRPRAGYKESTEKPWRQSDGAAQS